MTVQGDLAGKKLRELGYFQEHVVQVVGVSENQTSRVGTRPKSAVYDVLALTDLTGSRYDPPRRTRIQEHILRSKWAEVAS